jgi:hypothetical protein
MRLRAMHRDHEEALPNGFRRRGPTAATKLNLGFTLGSLEFVLPKHHPNRRMESLFNPIGVLSLPFFLVFFRESGIFLPFS